ncbi:MAG: hypothetical protein WCL51_09500 [Bacteroidota bacterium]
MDRKQDALFKKGKRIILVFAKYPEPVNSVLKLKESAGRYKIIIVEVDGIIRGQIKDIKGYAAQKLEIRNDAIEQALVMVGLVYVYAMEIKDAILASEMKLNKSDLDLKDDLCIAKLKNLDEVFNENKDELLDYGMTPEMIVEYTGYVEDLETCLENPAIAIGIRHSETLKLVVKLEAAELELSGTIENLMKPFKKINPDFFNEFESANKDTVLGSHKKRSAVTGLINVILKDKNTLDVIAEGLVKMDGDEEIYLTSKLGSVLIKSEMGLQKGNVVAMGYKPTSFEAAVSEVEQDVVVLMESN